jgi:hypothetical protein
MHLRAASLAFLLVGGGICVVATQVPDSRYRSGVAVVEVTVLARDAAGRSVTDLRRDELTVLGSGVAQKINGKLASGRSGSTREAAFAFNTAGMPVGDYVLRVLAAHSPTERVERRVPFEIVK